MKNRFAQLSTGRIVFDTYGTGRRAILLLHGIPGDRSCWREIADRFSNAYLVIVPDLRGFGESDPVPSGFHAEDEARVIVELIDHLELSSVHLVGFDFGGPIAVLVAGIAPERVESLTVANTNLFPDTPVPLPLRVASVPILGTLAYRLFFGRLGLMGMWLAATRRKHVFTRKQFSDMVSSAKTVNTTRDVFLTSMRNLRRLYGPVLATFRSLRIPILVIWSDRDPFFSVAVGSRVASIVPQGRFVLLENTGHFTPNERPKEFAEAVLAHLGEIQSSSLATAHFLRTPS